LPKLHSKLVAEKGVRTRSFLSHLSPLDDKMPHMIISFLVLLQAHLKREKFNKKQHYIKDYPFSQIISCRV